MVARVGQILVVAAVIEAEEEFLVCKRPEGKQQAGYWEFPGGKVVAGEQPEAALEREIREELGVVIEVGELFDHLVHSYEFGDVELLFYKAKIASGTPAALHHEEIRWLKTSQFAQFEFLPADINLIKKLSR